MHLLLIFSRFIKANKKKTLMITSDKVIDFFCAMDDFCKNIDEELKNMSLGGSDGKSHCCCVASILSGSEIIIFLIIFHVVSF